MFYRQWSDTWNIVEAGMTGVGVWKERGEGMLCGR